MPVKRGVAPTPKSRAEFFAELFPEAPKYRLEQLQKALFGNARSWDEVSTIPKEWRTKLTASVPFLSLTRTTTMHGAKGDTHKALLKTSDGKVMESVLMRNAREDWTICVSSQIGCAMACNFCATGRMGLTRNLSADEIVDQYRVWQQYLTDHPELPQRISNVVYMGMGEPLANYEQVRQSLVALLEYTDLGPTHITVSTVGLIPALRKLINDPTWPVVRLAVSLHSAEADVRKSFMPTSYDSFLLDLATWTADYFAKFESRRRHLTFEYVMLDGINNTPAAARALAKFSNKVGHVKVNLIPYNMTEAKYIRPGMLSTQAFAKLLRDSGVDVTRRRTMGDDIDAACGQLANKVGEGESEE